MAKAPPDAASPAYKGNPYRHWYYRTDANGKPTRAKEDTPTAGIEKTLAGLPDLQSILTASDLTEVETGPTGALPEKLPDVSDFDLIAGVIDTDIPLGHRAFRKASDGLSRVLYHWDMGQARVGDLPCGADYVKDGIDDLLRQHSAEKDPLKALDEIGFNGAIGAVDFQRMIGLRGLAERYAHGAHMLDMVAGSDPSRASEDLFGKRVGIVTVTMPSRWIYGEAGEFLDYYMLLSVLRLYRVVKAMRHRSGQPHLPAVISLAFGRQAGSKREDHDPFAFLLDAILKDTGAPFELIIPTGNDNVSRVVAKYVLPPKDTVELDWRLMPGDQTDNQLEIWTEHEDESLTDAPEIALGLVSPLDTAAGPATTVAPGHYRDLYAHAGKFGARVYGHHAVDPLGRPYTRRLGHVLCVGPVWPRGKSLAAVPSGNWKLRLENRTPGPVVVNVSVQTDQSFLPIGGISGRSYLDDPNYVRRDANGRLRDAIAWKDGAWIETDNATGVRQQGTVNTAASQRMTAVVGGYRNSDGGSAHYAGTGSGEEARPTRPHPSAALPTDDTVVLTGTISAGSSDGSKVAMRGTSFASSKAARLVAETWLNEEQTRAMGAEEILCAAALTNEHTRNFKHPFDGTGPGKLKFGEGRAPGPRPSPVPRVKVE